MMKFENYIFKKLCNKIIVLIFFLSSFYIILNNINFNTFYTGFSKIGNLFSRMFPIDFDFINVLINPVVETILMAFFSSFLAVLSALLFLPILTNILFDIKIIPRILSTIFSVFRTIPTLIVAAILVSLFSVGNFSGFMSLYIINFLMTSKLLKEYAEEIDKKYIDTFKSTGLNKFQIYLVAIIKNLKNSIYSLFFLTLESSIRGASILGLVGAGGIGQILWKELNHLRYDRVSLIILILIFLIIITDFLSFIFRKYNDNFKLTKNKYIINKFSLLFIYITLFISSLVYCSKFLTITLDRFLNGLKQTKNMLLSMIEIDISYLPKVLDALWQSLTVAFTSTFLASITVIFTSFFIAENLFGRKKSFIVKLIINILRTFPPIIVAIIFFRGFGPGMLSSFFALYIYTVGIMTKMYGEIIEDIDENIILSIRSLGINNFIGYIKIIFFGYLPEFITITLYRFELNIKNSTILGMVGAGGIGQLIINNIEFRNWSKISILLIVLCFTIIIIENISYYIRETIKK